MESSDGLALCDGPAFPAAAIIAGEGEVYELNCAAARAIAPGKSLVFAMQVRVPRSSPPGANGLFWGLDPFGARAPITRRS
jgi:hypothetical protein